MFQFAIVATCKHDILASAYPALQMHFSETNKLHIRLICKDSDTRRRYCIEQICGKMLLHALELTKYQSRHNLANYCSFWIQNAYFAWSQRTGYNDPFKLLVFTADSEIQGSALTDATERKSSIEFNNTVDLESFWNPPKILFWWG